MSQQPFKRQPPQPPQAAPAPKPEPAVLSSCSMEIETRPGEDGPQWRATVVTQLRSGRKVERTTGWLGYARFLMEYTTIAGSMREFIFDGQRPPMNVG